MIDAIYNFGLGLIQCYLVGRHHLAGALDTYQNYVCGASFVRSRRLLDLVGAQADWLDSNSAWS